MAEVIIMPKLGFNMDEGELVKWHKGVGDPVQKGPPARGLPARFRRGDSRVKSNMVYSSARRRYTH